MKFYIATLAFLSISSAMANSYYDRTKLLFDEGVKPEITELVGINTGRCFLRDDPYAIKGALIYGRIDNTGAGPIDSELVVAKAVRSEDPKTVDTSSSEKITEELEPLLPVREGENELLLDTKVSDARQIITYEVRKNKNYFVYRLGTFMYCYTYLKR